jgi:hypothetical protein
VVSVRSKGNFYTFLRRISYSLGRVMAQTVSRRPLTAEAGARSQVCPHEVYG